MYSIDEALKKFSDLTSNRRVYQKNFDPKTLKDYKNKVPVFSDFKSIEEIEDDIIDNPTKYVEKGSIAVRCLVSHLFTCDGGIVADDGILKPDRLGDGVAIATKGAEFLDTADGFSKNSEFVHGMVRWVYDKKGNVVGLVIAKDRGNCRCWMAQQVSNGEDVELVVVLHFHNVDPSMTVEDMIRVEAFNFNQDAVDRRGFDAKTKFRSGFLAEKTNCKAQAEFLDKNNIDFGGVVTASRISNNRPAPDYEISSIAKIPFGKDGLPHGSLLQYGKDNVEKSINTFIKIHDVLGEQKVINSEHVMILAITMKYMTESFKGAKGMSTPLTTKEELSDWFIWKMTTNFTGPSGRNGKPKNNLGCLSRKGGSDRDLSYKAWDTYMIDFLYFLKEEKGRTNNFSVNTPCLKKYIETIDIAALQTDVNSKLSNMRNAA